MEEADIPRVMDGLEMLKVDAEAPQKEKNRRVLRNRLPKTVEPELNSQRCTTKPRKRKLSEMESPNEIKRFYLNKSLKRQPNTLETIFEEKEDSNENTNHIGNKKLKRTIDFPQKFTLSKTKKKQRQAKIKKIFGSKFSYKKQKVTLQVLLDKLDQAAVML